MRTLLLIASAWIAPGLISAQSLKVVRWNANVVTRDFHTAEIQFTATIKKGWHIYSTAMLEGGPLPTRISFDERGGWYGTGPIVESGHPVQYFDSTFMIAETWYAETVTFIQQIKRKKNDTHIIGEIEFMACQDRSCLPPEIWHFQLSAIPEKP